MNEKEKKAIEKLKERVKIDRQLRDKVESDFDKFCEDECIAIDTVLNLIDKQNKELNKLKSKNKELLRKLRNRVKENNKLIKYSNYKKEFSTLNKQIDKQNKVIDEKEQEIEYLNCIIESDKDNYINKDTIKEKIEEIENMYNKLSKNPKEHLHSRTEYKIVIGELQSLLERS